MSTVNLMKKIFKNSAVDRFVKIIFSVFIENFFLKNKHIGRFSKINISGKSKPRSKPGGVYITGDIKTYNRKPFPQM